MTDPILKAFLETQAKEGAALADSSDLLTLRPLPGNPPTRYIAEFRCKGLVKNAEDEVVEADDWAVGIRFPGDYLKGKVNIAGVITYLGPSPRPFHPNIRAPFICMDFRPATPLVEILYGLFELFTWNLFATHDDGLNREASQWARKQPKGRFPIDPRPLRRRKLNLNATSNTTKPQA